MTEDAMENSTGIDYFQQQNTSLYPLHGADTNFTIPSVPLSVPGIYSMGKVEYAWFIINEVLAAGICVVGIFGNFMAIALIESSPHLKRLQSNVFFSVLTLSSNLFLITLFLIWIEPYFQPNIAIYNADNALGCKMITYLAHCSDFACVWLIVLVSVDRVMVLQWPELRSRIYTAVSARQITMVLMLVVMVGNCWLLMLASPVPEFIYGQVRLICAVPSHHLPAYFILNFTDTFISIVIPSLLIILANGFTVYKLRKYTQENVLCTPTVRFAELHQLSTRESIIPHEQVQDLLAHADNNNTNMYRRRSDQKGAFLLLDMDEPADLDDPKDGNQKQDKKEGVVTIDLDDKSGHVHRNSSVTDNLVANNEIIEPGACGSKDDEAKQAAVISDNKPEHAPDEVNDKPAANGAVHNCIASSSKQAEDIVLMDSDTESSEKLFSGNMVNAKKSCNVNSVETGFISANQRDKQTSRRIVRSNDLQLLKAMLIVTTVFLVLNIPSYLCRLFLTGSGFWSRFIWQFSYLLYYGHHAGMFYLYIFNSKQMRKELKPAAMKLLECYCLKTVPDFGHETPV